MEKGVQSKEEKGLSSIPDSAAGRPWARHYMSQFPICKRGGSFRSLLSFVCLVSLDCKLSEAKIVSYYMFVQHLAQRSPDLSCLLIST